MRTNIRPQIMLLAALLFLGAVLLNTMLRSSAAVSGPPTLAAPAPIELGSETMIARLREQIERSPQQPDAYAQLGLALLQRVRETGDPLLYMQAEEAFAAALERDPQHVDAMMGSGMLALSRHQFAEALRWGQQARALNPYNAQIYGVIADAQIELGQYPAAVETIQQMVDRRPDLSSYSRVSYLRELHGDTAGAIEAMQRAVAAGNPLAEGTLWSQVQLGHLFFNSGDLEQAEAAYMQALTVRPDYIYAFAGIARVRAAQGALDEAIDYYEKIVEDLPLPAFVMALGELYEATGQPRQARQQYELVRVMQQLNASAGMNTDLEMALFQAEHGDDPSAALQQARAAYQQRPTIYAADALAWVLYQTGEYAAAQPYSHEALRLHTRDALLYYHAGMIACRVGDAQQAEEHFRAALEINPFFSIRHAAEAREQLQQLEQEGTCSDDY